MTLDEKITIVIVTYNARHFLPDCLESVYRQDYPRESVKIIIVDNNSSDSTVGYVRENYPAIKLITNKNNLGFARANNQGYFLARKQRSDYLVLLNQDTIVEPNWLSHMVELAESDSSIGAVQPKILLHPDKNLINSFGNSIHVLGFAYCNKYREKDQQEIVKPFALPYASGAACLLKISVLEKTGLFDDRLFMYHEDVDLGWKIRLAGYGVMLDPGAIIYHKYNYSKAVYKFYYMDRNRWIVMLKNYKLLTLILIAPALLVMELGIIFFSIKNGWFKAKMRGLLYVLFHLPQIIVARWRVQFGIRQVKDRKILEQFAGSIRFQEIDNPILTHLVNPIMEIYFLVLRRIIFW